MNILAKQKSTITVCVAGVVAGYILQRLRQRATETLDKQKGLFAATGELLTQSQDVVRGVNAIVDKLQKGKLLPGALFGGGGGFLPSRYCALPQCPGPSLFSRLCACWLLSGPDYCPTPEEVAVEKAAWRAAVGPSMPMQIKAMLDLSNTVVARILDDERVGRILDKAGQPPPDADASADKPNVLEILDKVDNIVTKAVHAEENL